MHAHLVASSSCLSLPFERTHSRSVWMTIKFSPCTRKEHENENAIVQPGWDNLVTQRSFLFFSSLLFHCWSGKQLIITTLVSNTSQRLVRVCLFHTNGNWITLIFTHSWLVYILSRERLLSFSRSFRSRFIFEIIDEFYIQTDMTLSSCWWTAGD